MAVGATAVWRFRPSGNNNNGGGYDPGISGAATDYSQQNAAQATGTNGATSGAGATNFVDATANAFTSAMVGNAIQITSGTNFQAKFYFVTAFVSASTVTLDRTPSSGGAGSGGVWSLGGAWGGGDFLTNLVNTGPAPMVAGNIVYMLGSGTPNPSSYTFDYTTSGNGNSIVSGGGSPITLIYFLNDPATPGYKVPPDTTGGMPVIKASVSGGAPIGFGDYNIIKGLWFVASGAVAHVTMVNLGNVGGMVGCVGDEFATGVNVFAGGAAIGSFFGCEVFSSNGLNASVAGTGLKGYAIANCNVHDYSGVGIGSNGGTCINNIVSNCAGDGIQTSINVPGSAPPELIANNTIDANGGNGILVQNSVNNGLVWTNIYNNIITNHTGVSKAGLAITNNTAAQNNNSVTMVDYNTFYNNTANYSLISAGPHDTALNVSPYVNQSTENYTLA